MAIRIGTENKRQVYLAVALFCVAAMIAAWEIRSMFGSSSERTQFPVVHNPGTPTASAGNGRKSHFADVEPKLQIGPLSQIENVQYASTGRNIFSDESTSVAIETPVTTARPNPTDLIASRAEPPKPPTINLKYLGYVRSDDKTYNALVTSGEDSLIARTGEIIFHYYKVGIIQPSAVQLTDLRFNNTQMITVTEK